MAGARLRLRPVVVKIRSYFGVAAVGAIVPIVLSACGTPPAPKPVDDPRAKPPGSQQPSAAAPEARFAEVDNAKVSSLQLVTFSDQTRKVRAEVPLVPNARNLSQAIEVVREKDLRMARWAKSEQAEISSRVIASSPDAIGIVVKSVTTENGASAERQSTIWYDPSQVQSFSSPILVEESKWADFAKAVQEAGKQQKLDAGKLTAALADAPAPQGTGPAMGFDPEGNVVLMFDSGVLDAGKRGLVVPKDKAAGLLSAYGLKAQAAATGPSDYTAVGVPQQKSAQTTPGTAKPGTDGSATPGSGASTTPASGSSPASGSTPAAGSTPSGRTTPAGSATPGAGTRPSTAVGPDCRVLKCIALTYDDGPGAGTPKVVQTLEEGKAAATFFQMGQSIKANPDSVRLVAASGQEIGNHSVSHPDLGRLSGSKLDSEINGNSDRLKELTGRPPLLFRPPYGSHKDLTDKVIGAAGMAIINWNVDTNDWQTKSQSKTENSAVYQGMAAPNSIVLMHDIHDSSVAAAPTIVRDLQARGATLVTVSELTVNSGGVYPGHGYCHGTDRAQQGFGCKG